MEILVVHHSEGELRGGARGQEEASHEVAQPGSPPHQAEEEGGDQEELHVYRHVPGHVDTVRLPGPVDIRREVVDVEQVEPPALLTLGDQGRDQVGLRPARGKLEEGGVQGDDDGVDPGQSDVAVDVEHEPHHLVTPVGLVQLLHGVEGK